MGTTNAWFQLPSSSSSHHIFSLKWPIAWWCLVYLTWTPATRVISVTSWIRKSHDVHTLWVYGFRCILWTSDKLELLQFNWDPGCQRCPFRHLTMRVSWRKLRHRKGWWVNANTWSLLSIIMYPMQSKLRLSNCRLYLVHIQISANLWNQQTDCASTNSSIDFFAASKWWRQMYRWSLKLVAYIVCTYNLYIHMCIYNIIYIYIYM